MTIEELNQATQQRRAQIEAKRGQMLQRADQVRQALRKQYGVFLASTDAHIPEEQAEELLQAGKPFLCACNLCCLRLALSMVVRSE